MGRTLYLFCLSCIMLSGPILQAQEQAPQKFLVKVFLNTEDEKEEFLKLDFDLASYRIDAHAEVVASPEELIRLAELGYKTEIIPDFNSNPEVIEYPSYEEVYAKLQQLASDHPDIVQFKILGYSQRLHLPIPMIKISDHVTLEEDEPAILFDGQHHAREPVGMLCCFVIAEYLINNYESNYRVSDWVNQSEIFIVPTLNVEGWKYLYDNNLSDPWWRKNQRENNGNNLFQPSVDGVDLNRNYKFNHHLGGSAEMSSWTYRGPTGFSESETRAKRDLALAQKFVASITYHSYGEIILFPWNESPRPGDFELLQQIAGDMAGMIRNVYGSAFYEPVRCGCQVGQSQCWMYGEAGVLEVLIETADMFIPNRGTGDQVAWDNLDAALYLLNRMQGPGLKGIISDAQTGVPLQAIVQVVGIDNGSATLRTSDEQYGRYYRLLEPGTYSIEISLDGYETQIIEEVVVSAGLLQELNIQLKPKTSSIWTTGQSKFGIIQAFPNPFSNQLNLTLMVEDAGNYKLELMNHLGQLVDVPFEAFLFTGPMDLHLDLTQSSQDRMPAGVYFLKLSNDRSSWISQLVKN